MRGCKFKSSLHANKEKLQQGNLQPQHKDYELKEDGNLMFKGEIYVPNSQGLKNIVLSEMHNVYYVGDPRQQKIILVVKNQLK